LEECLNALNEAVSVWLNTQLLMVQ
jgi:hypothetical protein